MKSQSQRPLHIAVVGCGWFALRAHIPALRKLERTSIWTSSDRLTNSVTIQVVAVCSRSAVGVDKAVRLLGHEVHRYRELSEVLADPQVQVVDLVLPIPAMAEAIEACLAAGKHVISEKPAAPNPVAAAKLWNAYTSRALQGVDARQCRPVWCVAENWARKPGVLRVAELLSQGTIGLPCSYSARLQQTIPISTPEKQGWRLQAAENYCGGWALDVGVHIIRALRRWFGEIVGVEHCCKVTSDGSADVDRDEWRLSHEPVGSCAHMPPMYGSMTLEFTPMSVETSGSAGLNAHGVEIIGDTGRLFWNWETNTINICKTAQHLGTVSRDGMNICVPGDSWIQGGVRETLADALRQCALYEGLLVGQCQSADQRMHVSPCEESLKDAAVVYAMETCRSSTGPCQPICFGILAPGPHLGILNTTGTLLPRRPLYVARCSGISDVVQAVREAGVHLSDNSAGGIADMTALETQVTDRAAAAASPPVAGIAIKPVGAYNSWSVVNDASEGVAVETLSLMNRLIGIFTVDDDSDSGSLVCRTEPGMTLRVLVKALAARGLSLASLPILLDQTCGGAVGTGSHGSSMHHGTLSDAVVALTLVLPSGEVRHTSRDEPLLRAARLGLGRLGTIVHLDLRVVPQYYVLQRTLIVDETILTRSTQSGKLERLLQQQEHVWLHWRQKPAQTEDEEQNDEDGKEVTRTKEPCVVAICLEKTLESTANARPYDGRNWFPFSEEAMHVLGDSSKGPSSAHQCCQRHHMSMQYSLPLTKLPAAAHKIQRLVASDPSVAGRIVEVKFLPGSSRTLLGPNAGIGHIKPCVAPSSVACFNLWWEVDDPLHGVASFNSFERAMLELGAVPHFGKLHHIPALPLPQGVGRVRGVEYLEQNLRGYSEFESIAQKLKADAERKQQIQQSTCQQQKESTPTEISVIMPVYNAMPWLPLAVRDILRQSGPVVIELLAADDASTDGSFEFLVELASALGDHGSVELACTSSQSHKAGSDGDTITSGEAVQSTNPALAMAPRKQLNADELVMEQANVSRQRPMSASEVLHTANRQHRLRVLGYGDGVNRGQGSMMSLCLAHAQHDLIGHMESDDERPEHAFCSLMQALGSQPGWDGVCSQTSCIGWDRPGMRRYVDWQNKLLTPKEMRAARFLEIPCLHQAGLFRRKAVLAATENGRFRDDAYWAVDMHFWLSWFHLNLTCGKIAQELYLWRQHPGQQTRSHGRLSIENLRRCKIEFLCQLGGPIHVQSDDDSTHHGKNCRTCDHVLLQVWSCGQTLTDWIEDLRAANLAPSDIQAVEWRPGDPLPDVALREARKGTDFRLIRLFAYAMERPRLKVCEALCRDWDDALDLFVA